MRFTRYKKSMTKHQELLRQEEERFQLEVKRIQDERRKRAEADARRFELLVLLDELEAIKRAEHKGTDQDKESRAYGP